MVVERGLKELHDTFWLYSDFRVDTGLEDTHSCAASTSVKSFGFSSSPILGSTLDQNSYMAPTIIICRIMELSGTWNDCRESHGPTVLDRLVVSWCE